MATKGTNVNLLDLANLTHNGEVIDFIHSMSEIQDILKDAQAFEANEKLSHRYTRNASLVTGSWVQFNNGIDPSKGVEVPGRAEIGMLESRLQVDLRYRRIEKNFETFVERKAYAHLEGLSQQAADAIVLGTVSAGYHFNGMEPHIDALADTDQAGRSMFASYGGSTSLTSILAVEWGMDKVYLVYPQGAGPPSEGGDGSLGVHKEEYVGLVTGNNSKQMRAYACDFNWNLGLVIADDRCLRRIGNICTAAAANNPLHSTYTTYPIIDALTSMRAKGDGATLYSNRKVWGMIWKAANSATNIFRDKDNPWKAPEAWFGSNRWRLTDSLLNSETAIS